MIVIIDDNEDGIDCRKIEITVGDIYYKISLNKFNQLVVNKQVYDDSPSEIIIRPSVSNEIRIE